MTTDVASALTAKSDQLNSDDLIGGPIIIEITKVTNIGKGKEQPLIINYKDDEGKPWKPCKTMGRVMAQAWETTQGAIWVGRKVQLYRDPNVTFGPEKPGGIRISHLSHINNSLTFSVTAKRGSKKPYTVQPLIDGSSNGRTPDFDSGNAGSSPAPASILSADEWISDILSAPTLDGLKYKFSQVQKLFKDSPDFARIHTAKEKRKAELVSSEVP